MSIRVKLDPGTLGRQKLEWTLIDPAQTPTIEDLTAQITARRGLGPNIEILLDGCLLPGYESVAILQSGDVITVIRKEDSLADEECQDTRNSSDIMAPLTPQEKCPNEIWDKIFSYLKDADTKSLLTIRATCSDFEYWVDEKTGLWDRVSLFSAVKENNIEKCRKIVENAQDKNPADNSGWTPLHEAAMNGRLEICRCILENVQDKNPANNDGHTPLHRAAIYGHLEMCRLILDNVQDKNPARNDGNTPLHFAASFGHTEICRLILENVEDKNPADNRGQTPLHLAARYGHLLVCRLILENVQDKNPVNNYGRTPLNMARSRDIRNLIQDHL